MSIIVRKNCSATWAIVRVHLCPPHAGSKLDIKVTVYHIVSEAAQRQLQSPLP